MFAQMRVRESSRLALPVLLAGCALLIAPGARTAEPFPGNPPVTPYWALGHWVWEDNANTQASTLQLVHDYKAREIPVAAVIVDSPWETHYNTFVPDTTRYPDFGRMIGELHAGGVHVIAWATTFVNRESPDYAAVKDAGFVVDPDAGDITWWKGKGVHIDHTNPKAQEWLNARLDLLLKMGLDGWKVDMDVDYLLAPGPQVRLSAGSPQGSSMSLDEFQEFYYASFYDRTRTVNAEGVIMARGYANTLGVLGNKAPISRSPVSWQGDFAGDFAGIIEQARMVYRTAAAGYGCPGVEIGGYMGASATRVSLLRYAQFGALSCFMENGGSNGGLTNHLPWFWDAAAVDIYRYFAVLHSELAPYDFSGVVDAHLKGGSQMRSCDEGQFTHMLGPDLFVALITGDVDSRDITFPDHGEWIDYWNENSAAGIHAAGTTRAAYPAPIDRLPIFVRAGAIIPMDVKNGVTGHGDRESAGKSTILFYPRGDSSITFHRPTGSGVAYEDVEITMDEAHGTISINGPTAIDYRLRVKAFAPPRRVIGASRYSYDARNQVLVIERNSSAKFTIRIDGLRGYSDLRAAK